jgi:Family of unknown function (DUF5681)
MSEEYGNTSKQTQFKKRRSASLRIRPKKRASQVSEGSIFRKVAKEPISIEVDGVPTKMSRWEALMRQIYTMALGKDPSATRLLRQIRKHFPGDLLPGDPIVYAITEADARL